MNIKKIKKKIKVPWLEKWINIINTNYDNGLNI